MKQTYNSKLHLVEFPFGIPNMDPHFGRTIWTPFLDPGPITIWTPIMDPQQYGPPFWTPNMYPQYRNPLWVKATQLTEQRGCWQRYSTTVQIRNTVSIKSFFIDPNDSIYPGPDILGEIASQPTTCVLELSEDESMFVSPVNGITSHIYKWSTTTWRFADTLNPADPGNAA
jgi:hypothetical protein